MEDSSGSFFMPDRTQITGEKQRFGGEICILIKKIKTITSLCCTK